MSRSEGLIKLVITMFFVPLPVLAFAAVGFWLDYYRFDTLPLLTAAGAVLGTFVALIAVYRIIVHGHKKQAG